MTAFDEVLAFDSSAANFNGVPVDLGHLWTRSQSRARGTMSRTISLSGTSGNFDDVVAFDSALITFDAIGPSQALVVRGQSRSGTAANTTLKGSVTIWNRVTDASFDAAIGFDAVVAFGVELATAITRAASRVTIKPAPTLNDPGTGFDDGFVSFDGIDPRAFLVTVAPIIRVRSQSRGRGAVRSSGAYLGERPATVRTGQQKREPQRRRLSRPAPVTKLIRES